MPLFRAYPGLRNRGIHPAVLEMLRKGEFGTTLKTQKQLSTAQKFTRTLVISASVSALLYGGWKWRQARKSRRNA